MQEKDVGGKDVHVAPSREVYDAIVIGSGITGGWAAKELAEKGLKTLVLERGEYVEHGKDYVTEHMPTWEFEFRGRGDRRRYEEEYYIQNQCYAFGEATEHFFVNDKKNPYTTPEDKPFSWIRGYHLGGRSLMWGRQCYRWSDLDLEANARDGYGVDWPIRYADIASWYDYVERHVGISGRKEGLPQLPDGQFLPPMEMMCAERFVEASIEKAYPERDLTIGRVAVLTQNHKGRAACHYCGPCHRGCSTGSYFSSLSSTLPAAQQTGNLTIQCDAIVHSLIFDPGTGRVAGARVIDRRTKEAREYYGRVVFLCASALGSTQILLNSTSPRFPNGLANSSGALGHYLMDHPYQTGASGEVPGFLDTYTWGNRPNGVYLPRFRNLQGPASDGLDFVRGYGYQGGASRAGWRRGMGDPGVGKALKQQLDEPGPWRMGLGGWGEMLPRYENYVALDPDTKDAWGLPVLNIHCSFGDNEEAIRRDAAEQAAEMLEAGGVKNVSTYVNEHAAPGLCIHEMGTARMGRDPQTSVLNKWNQAHDVPNLFVTDGACMASSSCVNPSITYMALTARAADYAVQEMKRGNL